MDDEEENFPELFEQTINDYLGTNKVLDEVDGFELTDGRGFLSRVIRFKLKWAGGVRDTPEVPESLVLKVPHAELVEKLHSTISKEEDGVKDHHGHKDKDRSRREASRLWINKLHSAECTVYGLFGHKPPVPVPICYKHDAGSRDSPGVLILQNLEEVGQNLEDFSLGLNLEKIYNIVDILCDLHAWSLRTIVPWRQNLPKYKDWVRTMTQIDLEVQAKIIQRTRDELLKFNITVEPEIVKYVLSNDFLTTEQKLYENTALPVVFVHGDLWVNNILFRTGADGQPTNDVAGIVDWQMAHSGSLAEDFNYLCVWNVDTGIRRTFYDDIVHHYCNKLTVLVGKKALPPFEQVMDAFRTQFVISTMFLIVEFSCVVDRLIDPDSDRAKERKRVLAHRLACCYEDSLKILLRKKGLI